MIDEKNLIEKLEMLRFFNQRSGRELWQDKQKAVQDIDIENADEILSFAIESLRKREWIPCSDRLPEEKDYGDVRCVLAITEDGDYWPAHYWNGEWVDDEWAINNVVAWMPLPELYKKEVRE